MVPWKYLQPQSHPRTQAALECKRELDKIDKSLKDQGITIVPTKALYQQKRLDKAQYCGCQRKEELRQASVIKREGCQERFGPVEVLLVCTRVSSDPFVPYECRAGTPFYV